MPATMAFHQPTRQIQQRVVRAEPEEQAQHAAAPQLEIPAVSPSQTWVLFSPATDADTTASYLTDSAQEDDQPTPGRSRISDLGSLGTLSRSDLASYAQDLESPITFPELNNPNPVTALVAAGAVATTRAAAEAAEAAEAAATAAADAAEDDAELDSLDSHLAEFRTVPNPYSRYGRDAIVAPVLPAHDGLGSFRLDGQGIMSPEAQNQLYAFEAFNPHRVKRRRESLELGQAELESEEVLGAERNMRIEAWRMEQSRLVLNEIRKETRRRRQSLVSAASHRKAQLSAAKPATPAAATATGSSIATMSAMDKAAHEIKFTSNDWHDQEAPKLGKPRDRDGLWTRITRRVIRDLMGIDDSLLGILFGEALPNQQAELAALPQDPVTTAANTTPAPLDSSWQLNMLERIATELGLLLNHMSTHPGAFSAYARVHQIALPYAGLPVIPESATDATADSCEEANVAAARDENTTAPAPQFWPTMAPKAAGPDGLPTRATSRLATGASEVAPPAPASGSSPQTFTQREWEQDLDVRLVFRYLRSRFSSTPRISPFESGTAHLSSSGSGSSSSSSSAQDAAIKAARVRQHHPLIMMAHLHHTHGAIPRPSRPPLDRRAFKATSGATSSAAAVAAALRHHQAPGSCASSTRRSHTRRSSMSSRASSRHYWDIDAGGSIGTGSMVASAGPMGSWSEV